MRCLTRQRHPTMRSRTARSRRQPVPRASRSLRGVSTSKIGPWRLRWTRPDGSSFAGGLFAQHAEAQYWADIAERGNLESCVVTVEPIDP